MSFTPANIHDSRAEPILLNGYTKLAVGDGAYGGKAMNDYIFEQYGTIVIAPPHPKQDKILITKIIAEISKNTFTERLVRCPGVGDETGFFLGMKDDG